MAANRLTRSYLHVPRQVPYIGRTVGQQLDIAVSKYGDKEMYVFYADNERMTFNQIQRESFQLAASLTALGLTKGDVMFIIGDVHAESLVTFFACAYIGVIVSFVVDDWTLPTVHTLLNKTKARAAFFTRSHGDFFNSLCKGAPEENHNKFPYLHRIIYTGKRVKSEFHHIDDVLLIGTNTYRQLVTKINDSMDMDDPLVIYFTSGSTGFPKAVLFSHRKLDEVSESFSYRYGVRNYTQDWETKYVMPNAITGGSSFNGMMIPIIRGCTTVIPFANYDVNMLARAIHYERCTEMIIYIHQLSDLINLPDRHKYDFSSIQIAMPTGSCVPLTLRKQAENTGIAKVTLMSYGTTEFGGVFLQHPLDEPAKREAPVYYPVGGIEVKIINNEDHIVPIHSKGEVYVRGFSMFLCYLGDDVKTKTARDPNGWFYTGDIGEMDGEGFLHIHGRKSDFIHKMADNVAPGDLEGVLYQHPDIQDAVVVRVPDERTGEEVCACVISKSSSKKPSFEEICKFAADKVSHHYSVPTYVLFFDTFPATDSGKFHRRKLETLAAERLSLSACKDPVHEDHVLEE